MADQPEVIQKQMEETRASLTEKLEALESQVAGTVRNTTETVAETVEAVKETVENVTESVKETVESVTESVKETAHSVAETFNLRIQFERHPWLMFGGSIAVGCAAGYFLGGPWHRREHFNGSPAQDTGAAYFAGSPAEEINRSAPEPSWAGSSMAAPERQESNRTGWLWDSLGRLKGLAVGALMGVVRDMASRALPDTLQQRVGEEIDHLTTSLGGEPIHGHLLPEEK